MEPLTGIDFASMGAAALVNTMLEHDIASSSDAGRSRATRQTAHELQVPSG